MEIHLKRAITPTGEYDSSTFGIVYCFEKLLQETLNHYNYELFQNALLSYIRSEDHEGKDKKFNTIDEYLNKRLVNIGAQPFFIILYDAMKENFPVEQYSLFKRAYIHMIVANDLFSIVKERKEGEYYNALFILQEKNNDIKHNINELLGLASEIYTDTLAIEDNLTRQVLTEGIIGNIAWHSLSSRYQVVQDLADTLKW